MTQAEKYAKELVDKFLNLMQFPQSDTDLRRAKKCALICISEKINQCEKCRPEDEYTDLEEFDINKKEGYIYCVEWGMKDQMCIERGIYDKQIKKLEEVKQAINKL